MIASHQRLPCHLLRWLQSPILLSVIIAIGLLGHQVQSQQSLAIGCTAINFPAEAPHFVNDVEILPHIHVSESGILDHLTSPVDCQLACERHIECEFFTYRVNKLTKSSTCHLRPKPSDSTTAMIVSKQRNDPKSNFSYVSGTKRCGRSCDDGKEIAPGCGGSSPSACALIGDSIFDATCASSADNKKGCGFKGYTCCRSCKEKGSCCMNHVTGRLLDGGTHFHSSQWTGVRSAPHCHTLAVKTEGCTHWNYVTSTALTYTGGACYLKTYSQLDKPQSLQAESDTTSIVGAIDCHRDYGISKLLPTTTTSSTRTTTTTKKVAGEPIAGTCFSSKANIASGNLYKQWGIADAPACQKLCQEWPGCKSFVFFVKETRCELKFTAAAPATVTDAEASDFITGPRDCPKDTPAAPVTGCISGDMDINLPDLNDLSAEHAAECGNKCKWFGHCEGWTYFESRCYIKSANTPQVTKAGAASGDRKCEWPGYGPKATRRMLEQDEVLATEMFDVDCVINDKEFVGGEIDRVPDIQSIELCRHACLARADCKAMNYSPAKQTCVIAWGGELVDSVGVMSMPRDCTAACQGDLCRSVQSINMPSGPVQAVPGLAQHALGKPSEWIVKGEMIDFSNPSTWSSMSVHILTNDDNACFLSKAPKVSQYPSCGTEQQQKYFPVQLRVQIVAVAADARFEGWDSISWDSQVLSMSQPDGYLGLFDEVLKMDSGSSVYPIATPAHWPTDMMNPRNFLTAKYFGRFLSLSSPQPISFRVMFCISGSEDPISEICTIPASVPAYNV